MTFAQIDVAVVRLAHDRDVRLQTVVSYHHLVLVLPRLLREELHDDLLVVTRLQHALRLVTVEASRHF